MSLPAESLMRAEIVKDLGESVEIDTEKPDGIESEEGCYRFVILKDFI